MQSYEPSEPLICAVITRLTKQHPADFYFKNATVSPFIFEIITASGERVAM